jgi:hypothetical protein
VDSGPERVVTDIRHYIGERGSRGGGKEPESLLGTDERRRLEADRTRAELDHQRARREVARLHLIVRLLETRAGEGEMRMSGGKISPSVGARA